MNLATATSLMPSLRSYIGLSSIDGYCVKKFLIAPIDPKKQREFLEVYKFNKWNEEGLIMDCYAREELTIIVQHDHPQSGSEFQPLGEFLLKRSSRDQKSLANQLAALANFQQR